MSHTTDMQSPLPYSLEEIKTGLVLTVDKPVGWTSFQVVNKFKWQIRRQYGLSKFKIGHAVTLDPLASGLLLVCVGPATKQIEALQQGEKVYTGTMVLGATTPCFDRERPVDRLFPVAHLDEASLHAQAARMTGPLQQLPPTFSAVKVDGRRAYAAARSGDDVALKPKEVTLYDFRLTAFRPGQPVWQSASLGLLSTPQPTSERELYRQPRCVVPDWLPQLDFEVRCSKGTYIRSLARDFGDALHTGAFLASLRRHRIGTFDLSHAIRLAADDAKTDAIC